jgi:DNA (cytosine-5)-methyltransferase 1
MALRISADGMLTVGSLFSGIGGFDLGLERAGMRVVWQCEQDPFCRRVLAKHWPGVPCHPDVRALVADTGGERRRQDVRGAHGDEAANEGWAAQHADEPDGGREGAGERPVVPVPVPYVDVLCGGFPCQDLSVAGRQAGIDGRRSGLWGEYVRLVDVLRPRYVIVENVRNLLAGDRGRWFGRVLGDLAACGYDAEWDCIPACAVGAPHRRDRVWLVAYPQQPGLEGHGAVAGQPEVAEPRDGRGAAGTGRWESEPGVGRVAHGVPARVDRLRALGNALVPQIAQWLGERIVAYEQAQAAQAAEKVA